MTQQPLISVITITYNAAEVIGPTLESLRRQTFSGFEHIIVDGASSDATILVAREKGLQGARILSEPDKGLYDAMNKGLDMARGEYLLFLNAGDALHDPSTLGLYARAAASGPDIIYADTVIVDAGRKVIGPRHLSAPETLTFGSFADGMLICHQAFMVRREIAPRYDTDYALSADYDWTIRCIKNTSPGKCVNLHAVAIDYLADGLTDRRHRQSLVERFKIMRRHYGLATAMARHISFIPRAIARKFRR